MLAFAALLAFWSCCSLGLGQHIQSFDVLEGVPEGTVIGKIGGDPGSGAQPPYLIVPLAGASSDRDLNINQQTGVIRTRAVLDRERTSRYEVSAIPLEGESVTVIISVLDVNDNTPTFPESSVDIDIPENTPKGTRRKLLPAVDADLGEFGTQSYDIVSGNDQGVFLLTNADDELELIVNEDLDRERVDHYELRIVAMDGGSPPRTGTMTVNVAVQDLNDNPPVFSRQRYFTSVPRELSPGSDVLEVKATDADMGLNSRIKYSINRKQSDQDRFFEIDSSSGRLFLEQSLEYDTTRQVHEIVVVAQDSAEVPQETSAFITVRISEGEVTSYGGQESKGQDLLQLKFPNHRSIIPESTVPGEPFVKVALSEEARYDMNLLDFNLIDPEESFQLFRNSSGMYLALKRKVDFEKSPVLSVTIEGKDPTDPLKSFQETFRIEVEDTNDHAPVFEQSEYKASLEESAQLGTSVVSVYASDKDVGDNGRVSYSLLYQEDKFTDWFAVDETTGLITTQTFLDCEAESNPSVVVLATDHGSPKLSSTVTLSVSVSDVNDNKPIFESSFYKASLPESKEPGECFLKVKATDLDCGVNSKVHYKIKENSIDRFRIEQDTGRICLAKHLDHERQESYGFTVVASDKGGLSTSTMVKVEVTDTNDNIPVFKPTDYIAKIRSRFPAKTTIVRVQAEDKDSEEAGRVSYSITNDNYGGLFTIDSRTGEISLSRSLPRLFQPSYTLSIDASDGFGLQTITRASVEIRVDDDDLTFEMPQYMFEIEEDVSPYSTIGQVKTQFIPETAEMSIYDSNVDDYLSIDPRTGELRTEARLDHETKPELVLNVELRDSKTGRESFCQVIIKVKDVNDNAPEFGLVTAMATIKEDFKVGGVVYSAVAQDVDEGRNGVLSYRMSHSSSDNFRVDSTSGNVILTKELDYEKESEYTLTVEAMDEGNPPLKSHLKLQIHVHDVNDNRPQFDKEVYTIDLSESHTINSPIETLRAEDLDSGKNGRIHYSLERENPYVTVLQNSGVLMLKKTLDREFRKSFELTVKARDHGQPSLETSAKVILLISDKNDNSPVFDKDTYSFDITENEPAQTLVGVVRATDNDEGFNGQINFALKTPLDGFQIQEDTGKILTSKSFDREQAEKYELLVEAVDKGKPPRSSQTLVNILVKDVNDNAPEIKEPANKMMYVKKSSLPGTIIGKITTVDRDRKRERISIKVLDVNPVVSISGNGDVRLIKPLPSSESYYNVQLLLRDSGSPVQSREEILRLVKIQEGEERNLITSESKTIKVDRLATVGKRLGSLALSGHHNRNYIYKVNKEDEQKIKDYFLVDQLSGDTILIGSLNSAKERSFEFTVSAVSVNGETAPIPIKVVVDITEEQGPPKFSQDPISVSILEDSSQSLTVLSMSDFASGQVDRFDIVEQSPKTILGIDSSTGKLQLRETLDYERQQEYLVTVRGFSAGNKYSTDVAVVVNVMDVNDNAPRFLSQSDVSFSSESPVDFPLLRIVVSDPDSGSNGEVDVVISGGNTGGTFYLDPKTFDLSLKTAPVESSYQLVLRASDHGTPNLVTEQTLAVSFTATEASTHAFNQNVYRARVPENAGADQRVITVGLNRGNADGFVYTLLKGKKNFYINERTGEIKTSTTLDRESEGEHALVVSVSSLADKKVTDTAIVYVTVDDANDNKPKFGQSCRDISIVENSQDSYIHAFVANDPDSGDNGRVSYSLTENSDDSKFRIERDTGKLHALPLDREEADSYKLEVIAIDNGPERLTAKCAITVKVLDENDNDPSFTQSIYSASVKEDIQKGTEVLKVLATDSDHGDNAAVRYSLENASSWSFAINDKTGAIYSTEPLDRESLSEHRFSVLATDLGSVNIRSSSTQVKIIVTDANDHRPEFESLPFNVNMSATPVTGVPLLRLSARDGDIGPNGQLTYNIVRPEQREQFHLSPEEGLLTVASSDDASWEPGTVELLEVAVSDAGSPPKSSTGLVKILIEGGPAVTLTFQSEVYEANLSENTASGTDVSQVRAVRSDGRRQRVIYNFLRGNELGAFEINSNNGLIRIRDADLIDYEKAKQFNLTISAQGLGDEALTAYTTCVVSIVDVNDNPPKFTSEVYAVKVLEGNQKGSVVVQTNAVDLDEGQTETLTYDIIDGNVDGAFTMDGDKPGLIVTNIVLDREIRDFYELTISATDAGRPALVGISQVVVRVIDVNDNKPHFAPVSPVKVSRDVAAGTVVSTLRANDIDLAPRVNYRLEMPSHTFAIDIYTGQLILLKFPEDTSDISLSVIASDSKHETKTVVPVKFETSGKKCLPMLKQPLYNFLLSFNETYPVTVGKVSSTSCNEDSIAYEVSRRDQSLFSVLTNGSVIVTREPLSNVSSFILTVKDTRTKKTSTAVVTVSKTTGSVLPIQFSQETGDSISLREGFATSRKPITRLSTNQDADEALFYEMDENKFLQIDSYTGEIYSRGSSLNRERIPREISVTVKRLSDMQTQTKVFKVIPSGQLYSGPTAMFKTNKSLVELPENTNLNSEVPICEIDSRARSPFVKILSGNEGNFFSFDGQRLKLVLNKELSHQKRPEHKVVLKLDSNGIFSLCKVTIKVTKKAQHQNIFPVPRFVTSISENVPSGSVVPGPPMLPAPPGTRLTYWTDDSQFGVNPRTGAISTRRSFDYELATNHRFTLYANHSRGAWECQIEVLIDSRDEYPPVFEQSNYYFSLNGLSSVGDVVGQVQARDRDDGPDGFVSFSLAVPNKYFSIDPERGVIKVAEPLDTGVFHGAGRVKRAIRDVRLAVNAKSNQPESLETSTLVVVSLEESVLPVVMHPSEGMGAWLQGTLVGVVLLIIILVIVILFVCKRKMTQEEQARKFGLIANTTSGQSNPNMSMELNSSSSALSRFPPQYSEIVSDYERAKGKGGNTRSELSEKSHRSASSGRGSVEEGDDEVDVEIRMINEGSYLAPDGSFHDDKLSETSAQNTEDYLARLGIDIRKPPNLNLHGSQVGGDLGMSGLEHSYAGSNSIYNRIPDDALSEKNSVLSAKHSLIYGGSQHRGAGGGGPSIAGSLSSIVHSEEELAGSYNWDYLLDWGPQYQPLAHVFKEISRLKDAPEAADGNATAAAAAAPSLFAAKNPHTSHLLPARASQSPISHHDGLMSYNALSPNFNPALSPLATKSPSVSPPLSAQMQRGIKNQRL